MLDSINIILVLSFCPFQNLPKIIHYYTYQRIPEISFPLIVHSVTVPPGLCIDSFLKDFNIMILRVVSSQFRYLRTRDR